MTNGKMQLIRKLRNPDNEVVLQAVEELREHGWLQDGTLEGMGLQCVHLQGADLHKASLQEADLRLANLKMANLRGANLRSARLNRSNLQGADLGGTDLRGADLFDADLEWALNLTDKQLMLASRLRSATMLDGHRYDGRFNLPGDLWDADALHIDCNDAVAMANFYHVSLEEYQRGQKWALEHLSHIRREIEMGVPDLDVQLIVKLREPANKVALEAIEELRERGWLNSGMLKGLELRHANLQGANLNLASLEGIDLSEANLQEANLSLANLQGANLSQANLQGAKLLWAGLQKADMVGIDLQGADMTGANLRNAQLNKANLQGANLSVVNLKRADLFEANLEGARNLREEELAKANRLWGAILPDGSRYDGRFNLPGDVEFVDEESDNSVSEAAI